uniref:Uncharacterized protein n=2 Tax=Eutreptiella gymnastica TaxID=73025 RepID=A0A7S1HWL7_9EUGL|mmetsp:Transcript_110533/g.191569  ORF Transcript_110533/g.191569 Transcript_110533/m.191569 type:complete len:118 (+) Transcript_110533:497-850(+)
MGYADDTYGLGANNGAIQEQRNVTELWLHYTGQTLNAKKSLLFATAASDGTQVKIEGVNIPPTGGVQKPGSWNPADRGPGYWTSTQQKDTQGAGFAKQNTRSTEVVAGRQRQWPPSC